MCVVSAFANASGARSVCDASRNHTGKPQVAVSADESYGLGWVVSDYKGLLILSHAGNTLGCTSQLAFLPGHDIGISILTNQHISYLNELVGTRLLELLWGASYLREFDPWDLQLCLYLSLGGLAALYLINILVSSLMALNKIRVVIPVSAGAVVMVVVGNLLLIPRIGLPSVGVFFVASNILVLLTYWNFLRWRGYSLPVWREAGISMALALPAVPVAILMRNSAFVPAFMVPILLYVILWLMAGGYKTLRRLFPFSRTDSS